MENIETCVIFGHQIKLRGLLEQHGVSLDKGLMRHLKDSDILNAMKWCCHAHMFKPGDNIADFLDAICTAQGLKIGEHHFRRYQVDQLTQDMCDCTHLGIVWGVAVPTWSPSFFYKDMYQAPFALFLWKGEEIKPFDTPDYATLFYREFLELEEVGRKEWNMPEPDKYEYSDTLEGLLRTINKGHGNG